MNAAAKMHGGIRYYCIKIDNKRSHYMYKVPIDFSPFEWYNNQVNIV